MLFRSGSDRSHNNIGGRVPAGHAFRDGGIVRKGEVGALRRQSASEHKLRLDWIDAITNLVELTIAAVEDELNGDVRAISDALHAGRRKVDVHAEVAHVGRLKERQELLKFIVVIPEGVEAICIFSGRNNATDC